MEERKFLLILRLIGVVLFGLAGFLASQAMELGEILPWMAVALVFAAANIIYLVGSGVFAE